MKLLAAYRALKAVRWTQRAINIAGLAHALCFFLLPFVAFYAALKLAR